MEVKFCPFCQRKNKEDAIRCQHCGVLLIAHTPGSFTTASIQKIPAEYREKQPSLNERHGSLPFGSFALFVMDFEEPLVLQNQPKVIIGRDVPANDEASLDMSRYGDLSLGISRHHAQISYENGSYTIEDLGSTNGTWLNRRRLTAKQPHPLQNNDHLWLGPLKMVFCFATAELTKDLTFALQMGNSVAVPERQLTPQFLLAEVAPYLQAIAQFDAVRAACVGQTPDSVYLLSIQETNSQMVVKLEGAALSVALIDKWIGRWRDEHLEMVGTSDQMQEAVWQEALLPLAKRIVDYLQPTLSDPDMTQLATRFLPSLVVFATSRLEMVSLA